MIELAALIIVGGFVLTCAGWILLAGTVILGGIAGLIGEAIEHSIKFVKGDLPKKVEAPKIVEVKKQNINIEFDDDEILDEECDPTISRHQGEYVSPYRARLNREHAAKI